jgi:hypothetical protein
VSHVKITPTDNGSYLIEGPIRVVDAGRTEYDVPEQTTHFAAPNRAAHREGARP